MSTLSSRAGTILGGLGRVVLWLLLVLVAFGQLLAWTSPSWWVPVLQWWPAQYVVIAAGVVRDALGAWAMVAAALLMVLMIVTGRERRFSLRRPGVVLSALALVSSVALYTYQVTDARSEGADVALFTPALPFTNDLTQPDDEVVVGSADGQDLLAELYLPETDGEDLVPVVLRVHGGGFTSGAPGPSPYFPPLLEQGYAVLDVSYRLASPDKQTWDLAVADVGCALTWVTSEGPAAGLDPTRVGMLGESAGGQLAVNAGNMAAEGSLEPSCRDAETLPDVTAVVAGYPAVDGAAAYEDSALGAGYGDQYVGGSIEEFPERYEVTDSINHVGPDGPPLMIYQGSADHLILPGPVKRFAEASSEAGTTTRYVELPGQEHTTGGGLGTLSFGDVVARDLTTQWFAEHL